MVVLPESAGSPPGPRPERRALTTRFAATWPEVERSLRAYLASLGASAHQIDDVVQETAARALERSVPYQDVADLRRWCFVVARHAWVDEVRRGRRVAPLELAEGRPICAGDDALRRVEDRHVLRQIARALPRLRQADRDALTGRPQGAADAAQRNSRNVARHRARARLRLLMGPLAGAGALPFPAWVRRLCRPVPLMAAPAMVAFGALLGAVPLPGAAAAPPAVGATEASPQFDAARPPAPLRTASTVVQYRPGGLGRLGVSVPARAAQPSPSAPPPADHPRVAVTAPAETHVSVVRDDQEPGEPLICLNGSVVNACADLPRPVGGLPTDPHRHAPDEADARQPAAPTRDSR